MVTGPSGSTQTRAAEPAALTNLARVSSRSGAGSSRALRICSALRPRLCTCTLAFSWICAWICACHWSCLSTDEPRMCSNSASWTAALAQELPVEPVLGDAVPAFGCDQDRPARFHDLGRGAHALHRLVQVQVERVAGVGGDHDVEAARRPPPWRSDGRNTAWAWAVSRSPAKPA